MPIKEEKKPFVNFMDFEVITRLTYKTSDNYTGYIVQVKSKKK